MIHSKPDHPGRQPVTAKIESIDIRRLEKFE
jgi:hypothetical protein